jgi:hypothetical protein
MTRARALKQVIRARAAKTGERYTTARRHVLTQLRWQTPHAGRGAAPAAPEVNPVPLTVKGGLSDAKAREKTGHGLAHWFDVLDRFGGVARGHTALARHLAGDHGVPGWHAQGITVAYERARGARTVNQRCDGEFEVSVSKVIAAPARDVIATLGNVRSRRHWTAGVDADLAQGLTDALDAPRSKGIVVRPDGQGRFRYKWDGTTVQISFLPKPGDKVSVVVTNSKLANAAAVEQRRALWRAALDAVARSLGRQK